MRYNVTINLNVDYDDSALGIRKAIEQTLLNNTTGMTVEIRSTEVHLIEEDVIKLKGGKYSINAWLQLLPTDLLQEIKDESRIKIHSSATGLVHAIHSAFDWENSKRGMGFWAHFCNDEAKKIEDEYFEKIGQQNYSYFISKLSEPFRTDGLNFLTSKENLNKPCKKMSWAILAIDWMQTPNVTYQQWLQLSALYCRIENEVTQVATPE